MDTSKQEPTLEESIAQVMQTLPPVIRAYIAQGKYTAVAKSMMTKYSLRIDQGGVLEREIMLLLMGIDNPSEFIQALTEEAKLDQKTIDSIAQDVNDQIFVPLRQEEENGGATTLEVRPSSGILKSEPQIQIPQPDHIAPLPPKVVMPRIVSLDASKMLEDHDESHIEFTTVQAPQGVALRSAQAAPQFAPPPPNLHGAMPDVRPSPAISKIKPTRPSTVITAYTSDPYREPIDKEG